jgi:hypothetical protein
MDILTMHGPINVKSPNNIRKWQMGFNSAFKGLTNRPRLETHLPRHSYGNRRLRLQFERAPYDGHNNARKHVEQRLYN